MAPVGGVQRLGCGCSLGRGGAPRGVESAGLRGSAAGLRTVVAADGVDVRVQLTGARRARASVQGLMPHPYELMGTQNLQGCLTARPLPARSPAGISLDRSHSAEWRPFPHSVALLDDAHVGLSISHVSGARQAGGVASDASSRGGPRAEEMRSGPSWHSLSGGPPKRRRKARASGER